MARSSRSCVHDYVDALVLNTGPFYFGRGGVYTVITNSLGLCIQRSGLEEAQLIKVEYLK